LARRLGIVAVGGDRPGEAAKTLLQHGVTSLLSFGLAGGLDPALRPGDVVIPRAVLAGDRRFATAPLLAANVDILLAGEKVHATSAEKLLAWQTTGAAAVDLESGAVAQVAAEAGIGFAVLRAICDPAERDLPPAALTALDHSGRIGFLRVLASVVTSPSQIPALLRLAADAKAARQALRRANIPNE
jgi:adenosylhomocysteine nucleosidase